MNNSHNSQNGNANETIAFNETMQVGMDRCAMLEICLENAFEKISSSVSEQDYSEALGNITKSKSVPGKVRNKMKTSLYNALSDEVKSWIEDEEVNHKLKELDKIVEECPSHDDSKKWRPNGNVQDHMRSVTMAAKLKHMKAVEEDVKDEERTNEALQEQVSAMRSEVKAILHKIQVIGESSSDCKALKSLDSKVLHSADILFGSEL